MFRTIRETIRGHSPDNYPTRASLYLYHSRYIISLPYVFPY